LFASGRCFGLRFEGIHPLDEEGADHVITLFIKGMERERKKERETERAFTT